MINLYEAAATEQQYWRIKALPPVLIALEKVTKWNPHLLNTEQDACYSYPRKLSFTDIHEIKSHGRISRPNNGQRRDWHLLSREEHPAFQKIKTSHAYICSAELLAIMKPITLIEESTEHVVIITDSKSALESLHRRGYNTAMTTITWMIKNLTVNSQTTFSFMWVPSHTGIRGNEKADELAQTALQLENISEYKLHYTDLKYKIHHELRSDWIATWQKMSESSGRGYAKIVENTPYSKPWFAQSKLSRRHVTTIIRMRTGHCATPVHMHRIGVQESEHCSCGWIGTLDHIIFECPLIRRPTNFYADLCASFRASPMSVTSMLHHSLNFAWTGILNVLIHHNVKL